jgi:hypothetical protein
MAVGIECLARTGQPLNVVALGANLGGIQDRVALAGILPSVRLVANSGAWKFYTALEPEITQLEEPLRRYGGALRRKGGVPIHIQDRCRTSQSKGAENLPPILVGHDLSVAARQIFG